MGQMEKIDAVAWASLLIVVAVIYKFFSDG